MVDKIKKMYPDYLLFIKKKEKLYDLCNKEVTNDSLLKRYSYIIIEDNSYEVHKKIEKKQDSK